MGFRSSFVVVHYVQNHDCGGHCKAIEEMVKGNKFLKCINEEWNKSKLLFEEFVYVFFDNGVPKGLKTIDQARFVKKFNEYDWSSTFEEITSSTDMTIVGLYGLTYDGSLSGGPRYSDEPQLFSETSLFACWRQTNADYLFRFRRRWALGDIPLFHAVFINNESNKLYVDGYKQFLSNPTTNVDLEKPFPGDAPKKIGWIYGYP